MSLEKALDVTIRSGQVAIMIHTDEIDDTHRVLNTLAKRRGWPLSKWNPIEGLTTLRRMPNTGANSPPYDVHTAVPPVATPHQAIVHAMNLSAADGTKPDDNSWAPFFPAAYPRDLVKGKNHILVIDNATALTTASPNMMIAAVQAFCRAAKGASFHLVFISPPAAKLPEEIAPLFYHVDHELPDEDELLAILEPLARQINNPDFDRSPEALRRIAAAARGLTRLQAENVFAACGIKNKTITVEEVWSVKARILNQDNVVELLQKRISFDEIGGNAGIKDFLCRILAKHPMELSLNDLKPRGVAIVGVPGTGKTMLAQATGTELGMPTVLVDIGRLLGEYIGNTERNTRRLFAVLKAMSPCIAVIDEFSKAMPSTGNGQDSGVGSRMVAQFLTQMNDMQETVFWVFTENDIRNTDPAFFRSGRMDAVFYSKLPTKEQRAEVWRIYLRKFFPETYKVPAAKGKFENVPNPNVFVEDINVMINRYQAGDKSNKSLRILARDISKICLTCKTKEEVSAIVEAASEVAPNLAKWIQEELVNDENWTPAEIADCCRKACRLNITLTEAAGLIRPVAISDAERITVMDKWATNNALDMDTGKLFGPDTNVRTRTDAPRRRTLKTEE